MRPILILLLRLLDALAWVGVEIAQAVGWRYWRARNWLVKRLAG